VGLVVYNTLTKKYEPFEPLENGRVSIYVCGITPYEESHIGHARSTVVWDVIKRYLTYLGYKVKLIQNFTDIDDKLIAKSKETGISPMEIARKYSAQYLEAMDKLGVQRANAYPRASQVIPQIIHMVKALIDKGYAYESSGDVYFIASKFQGYGKLSGKKLDELKPGARVDLSEKKRSQEDWALWKNSPEGEIGWPSPWGEGRPGWHIECSVMVQEYLGESIDFHGGGSELVFPHHENEIAQSESYSGKPFVKYWLHHEMVNLGGEKMSKSLGNIVSLKEILDKYDPMGVRLFLLSAHRLKPIEYSADLLESARRSWERINTCLAKAYEFLINPACNGSGDSSMLESEINRCREEFFSAMDYDFNFALALSCVHELVKAVNSFMFDTSVQPANSNSRSVLACGYGTLLEFCGILGLRAVQEKSYVTDDLNVGKLVDLLVEIRDEARRRKDYEMADGIRNKLAAFGLSLEDTPSGTKWKIAK
jgi:cysteinyl-tRNA synthetase